MVLINKFLNFMKKPQNIILISLTIILGYLLLVPLISIVVDTFIVHPSEVIKIAGKYINDFTTYHWKKVFADGHKSINLFYKPLWNTILVALSTCAVSITLGGAFAWLVTRTDIRFKNFISTLFMFSFIMPSWTLAMA